MSDETPQARYERLLGRVLRMGGWLSGPQARPLPEIVWQAQFARYQEHLEELRRLGDERGRSREMMDKQIMAFTAGGVDDRWHVVEVEGVVSHPRGHETWAGPFSSDEEAQAWCDAENQPREQAEQEYPARGRW